jgi:hypothetical protein
MLPRDAEPISRVVKVKQNQSSGERRRDGSTDRPARALSIAELELPTRSAILVLNAGLGTAGDVLAALSVRSETLKGFGIGRW